MSATTKKTTTKAARPMATAKPKASATPEVDISAVELAPNAPTTGAPTTPVGYVAEKLGRVQNPTHGQVSHAAQAGTEITDSTTFEGDFGAKGTPQAILGQNLINAAAWSVEDARTENWRAYVKQQRNEAWQVVFAQLDMFQQVFNHALAADPTIATTYPSLAALLGVRRAAAKKAVATRKRAAKATASTPAANTVTTTTPVAAALPAPVAVAPTHAGLAS